MIEIVLYNNTSEINRVDKSSYLTQPLSFTGALREETSIISPSVIITHSNNDIINCNYGYIPEFKRYYFITNISSVRNNIWRIDFACDTLMSFKNDILNLKCYIGRQEYQYDNYLPDEKMPCNIQPIIDKIYTVDEEIPDETNDFKLKFIPYKEKSNVGDYNLVAILGGCKDSIPSGQLDNNTINYFYCGVKPYFLKLQNINKLMESFNGGDFWEDIKNSLFTTPSETLLSIKYFPTSFPLTYNVISETNSFQIGYSNTFVTMNNVDKARYVSTLNRIINFYIDFGTYYILPKYKSFLDYEPYTKISLNLPYLGRIDLPTNIVMNRYIKVKCYIDIVSGGGTFVIQSYLKQDNVFIKDKLTIYKDVQIGQDLPISKTNQVDISRQKLKLGIDTIGQLVSNGVSLGSSFSKLPSNFKSARSKTAKAFKSGVRDIGLNSLQTLSNDVTNFAIDYINANQQHISSYNLNGDLSNISLNEKFIEIMRPDVPNFDNMLYNHTVGRTTFGNYKLNVLYGYTEVVGVHLDNIPRATSVELEDIENKLRNGVLLPDKPTK